MAFDPRVMEQRILQLEREVATLKQVQKGIHSITQGWAGEVLTVRILIATSGVAGGVFLPVALADASAPNNSIYYSTTATKLVYKDAGGVVNNLY